MAGLMKTGQLAKKAGVPASTVRYYTQIGLLEPDSQTQAGYNLYGLGCLERLAQIVHWRKKERMTIDEIRERLEMADAVPVRRLSR